MLRPLLWIVLTGIASPMTRIVRGRHWVVLGSELLNETILVTGSRRYFQAFTGIQFVERLYQVFPRSVTQRCFLPNALQQLDRLRHVFPHSCCG